jgi:hypothetical protein
MGISKHPARVARSQAFTASGTWVYTGAEWVDVLLVGGGGGGGGGDSDGAFSGGGGGGGEIINRKIRVTSDLTVTIGAVAAGGNQDADGTAGNNSTLAGGAVLTAYGGAKGLKGAGADGVPGIGGGKYLWEPVSSASNPSLFSVGLTSCAGGGGGKSGVAVGSAWGASPVPGYGIAYDSPATAGGCGGGSYGAGGLGVAGAAGGAAAANSGGGGSGGGDSGNFAGGAGGSGYCVICWEE